MFEKIKERFKKALESAKNKQKISDEKIALFGDDLATNTQWEPLKRGGANFKTHNLIKISSSLLKYQISTGTKILFGVFALIGIVAMAIAVFMVFEKGNSAGWFVGLIGLIFFSVSLVLYKILGRVTVLDHSIGMMYKGNKPPKLSGAQTSGDLVYLNDVYAIQIIKEYIRTDKSSYYSYEINFVMKDTTRVNVMDHGNLNQIQLDAKEIALFIGKPLWDATQF